MTTRPQQGKPQGPTPPNVPTNFLIPPDIVCDYLTGIKIPNPMHPPYGFTGLMTVKPWTSAFYGTVAPGTVFLFPGNDVEKYPSYDDPLYINGQKTPPINHIHDVTPTRHQSLCNLLDQKPAIPNFTTYFVGFSCYFPFWELNQMKYNSNTCNPFWFPTNELPRLPFDWQNLVRNILSLYLPTTPRVQITQLWNNTHMALTLQADGSIALETPVPKNAQQTWFTVPGQITVNQNPVFYLVNPYQLSTEHFQLFGDGKAGDALTTGPFDPGNKNGQWVKVPATHPYFYLQSQSGDGTLVLNATAGDAGTVIQLGTQNGGPGQLCIFAVHPLDVA